jgi:NAD(P)H dehydrogenase (quinone)
MPAVLKGFFDRIFTSGFAFKYENGVPKGLLKGKKAAIFITSGAPVFVTEFLQAGRVRKSIKYDILRFCGIKSRVFQIGNATTLTDAQRKKISSSVKNGMKWLYG